MAERVGELIPTRCRDIQVRLLGKPSPEQSLVELNCGRCLYSEKLLVSMQSGGIDGEISKICPSSDGYINRKL